MDTNPWQDIHQTIGECLLQHLQFLGYFSPKSWLISDLIIVMQSFPVLSDLALGG